MVHQVNTVELLVAVPIPNHVYNLTKSYCTFGSLYAGIVRNINALGILKDDETCAAQSDLLYVNF